MMRKLGWLAVAVALAVPAATAWAADGQAGSAGKACPGCCCCCDEACPK